MISLDNADLFLRVRNLHPQVHAKRLDKLLGYRISKIEVKLLQQFQAYDKCPDISNRKGHFEGAQAWIGLHPQALQTPYNDLYEVFFALRMHEIVKVVDVGCAYGRIGIVMSHFFPQAHFVGYEIVKPRAREANRVFQKHALDNCEVVQTNILDAGFVFPEAQVYFIYDFGETSDIQRALSLILERMASKQFYLVVRGARVEALLEQQVAINHNWRSVGLVSILKIFAPKW